MTWCFLLSPRESRDRGVGSLGRVERRIPLDGSQLVGVGVGVWVSCDRGRRGVQRVRSPPVDKCA